MNSAGCCVDFRRLGAREFGYSRREARPPRRATPGSRPASATTDGARVLPGLRPSLSATMNRRRRQIAASRCQRRLPDNRGCHVRRYRAERGNGLPGPCAERMYGCPPQQQGTEGLTSLSCRPIPYVVLRLLAAIWSAFASAHVLPSASRLPVGHINKMLCCTAFNSFCYDGSHNLVPDEPLNHFSAGHSSTRPFQSDCGGEGTPRLSP